jgi:[ribosomal protein S5]-alanine N-acetyltransferase
MLIETDRLSLRSTTDSDAENLLALFNNEKVRRFLPPSQPATLDRIKRSIERRKELESKLGFAPMIIELRETGTFIGNAGLQPISETREIEIAYHFLPEFWGKGYATEAAIALLEFGFNTAGLKEIIGICFPENIASARVLEKAGMRFVGRASYFGVDGLKKYAKTRA